MITTSAIFAALIYVATLTGAVAPIGGGAYIHIGDTFIYIAALVLPLPSAVSAAVIGAGLADLTLGSAIYIIPSIIIKSLVVITIKAPLKLTDNPVLQDFLICLSGIVTVAGYYVAEFVLLLISGSNFVSAISVAAANSVIFNILQALASAALYAFVSGAVRKFVGRRKKSSHAEGED